MSILESIENNFTYAIIKRCSETGCELRLNNLTRYIVLKGENICRDEKICDCIIFLEDILIALVELKSRTAKAGSVVEKLTNGSLVAINILESYLDKTIRLNFYHIVLCKRWRVSEYRVITSRKISIRGKTYDIIAKRCGVSLSELISIFSSG